MVVLKCTAAKPRLIYLVDRVMSSCVQLLQENANEDSAGEGNEGILSSITFIFNWNIPIVQIAGMLIFQGFRSPKI